MQTKTSPTHSLYTHVLKKALGPDAVPVKERVVIVGTGYVGLPLCLYAAAAQYQVTGYDVDSQKVTSLQHRLSQDIAPTEQALLRTSTARFTDDVNNIKRADIYIICVPTPVSADHEPDLGPLLAAATTVGSVMGEGAFVIVESTVNPSVCEAKVIPTLEQHSGLTVGVDFHFAYCPERVNPGDETYTTYNIPRVVAGFDQPSLLRAVYFYEDVLEAPVTAMHTLKEAEAVKMVENAFRDVNIAFVNEMAMAFDRAGIDVQHVITGASSKPFAFMPHNPGCGVGGHCIPVDPHYLIAYGKENNFLHDLLQSARTVNESMPHYAVEKLVTLVTAEGMPVTGTKVALLGMSYKRDVADLRESPALVIKDDLESRGFVVCTFDPYSPEHSTVAGLTEALQFADAVLIATDHSLFCNLEGSDFAQSGVRVVVDGRNCLKKDSFTPELGVRYTGIGR